MDHLLGSLLLLSAAILWFGCSSNCCVSPSCPPSGPSTSSGPDTSSGPSTGSTGFDITKIQVGPENSISWEDAKALIQYADVRRVYQTHARAVYITLEDDTRYSTTEPRLDDVIHWIDTVGKREQIGIITQ